MTQQPKTSVALWIAQALLAIFLLMGAYLKFQPIDQLSVMMPWTGEVSESFVRVLGLIDLLGALGLMLPSLLSIKPQLTFWAALGVALLMVSACLFHIVRGEVSVIAGNIVALGFAVYIAWSLKPKK